MREGMRVLLSRRFLFLLAALAILNLVLYVREQNAAGYSYEEIQGIRELVYERYEGRTLDEIAVDLAELKEDTSAVYLLARTYMNSRSPKDWEWYKEIYQDRYATVIEQLEEGTFAVDITALRIQNRVLSEIAQSVQFVMEYPEFLQMIKENAANMQKVSIFSDKDSFSYKNIIKTVEDFEAMEGQELEWGRDEAVTTFFRSPITDYMILILIAGVAMIFLDERKCGLWDIVHTAKTGRMMLGIRRLSILLLASIVGCMVLYGSKLLTAFILYGGEDGLDRLIQSVVMFQKLPEPISIRHYLLFYFVLKIGGTFLVGVVLWLILSAVANPTLAVGAAALIMGAQYGLFTTVSDSSILAPLRYLNLFAYIDTSKVYSSYLNLNLFGRVVNGRTLVTFLLPVFVILGMGGALAIHTLKRPYGKTNPLEKLYDRLRFYVNRRVAYVSVFWKELCKSLIIQKGAVVLLVFIWLQSGAQGFGTLEINQDAAYYYGYCQKWAGEITEETDVLMQAEYEALSQKIAEVNTKLAAKDLDENEKYGLGELLKTVTMKMSALMNVIAYAEDQKIASAETGITAYIMDTQPYDDMFGPEYKHTRKGFIVQIALVLVLLLAGICAYEKQQNMEGLVRVTRKGTGYQAKKKMLALLSITAVTWLIIYGFEWIHFIQFYDRLKHMQAPVQSIPVLAGCPQGIPLWFFFCMVYVVRLMIMIGISGVIAWISSKCSKFETAVAACVGGVVAPALLVLYILL